MITWTTEKRKISELIPASYNPRELTEQQAKDLETSLERFDLADPIVINTNNTIIGGHQRVNIYKLHGKHEVEVDCRIPSRQLNIEEEKELNLRLNKNLGQWDWDQLANFDEDMLKDVGFDSKELDKIFQLDAKPEDDEIPEQRTTDIKLGDMFKLGEHRLLCGDSTKKDDVERLMGDDRAAMVFTDPPYGVSFKYNKYDDDKTKEEHADFCGKWFNILKQCSDFIVITPGFGNEMIFYGLDKNFHHLVWKKKFALSATPIAFARLTEPIFVLGKPRIQRYDTDFFEFHTDREKELHDKHPCPKPVALIESLIEPQTKREESVLDVFGGSGSTLIACEKLNRKCRMMEIDQIYCQVIIDRWEKFTGKKSEKCPQ